MSDCGQNHPGKCNIVCDPAAFADPTPTPEQPHRHGWRDAETVRVPRTEHSPVSRADDYYYTAVILVQSCECGEFRKVTLAHEARP